METTTVMMGAFRKRRLAALGLFGLASLLSAQPGLAEAPARTDIELVRQVAPQNAGPGSAKAFQWAADLDIVAQGLAKLLKDPAAMDTLRTQMMARQLPENPVRLVDLLGVQGQGRGAGGAAEGPGGDGHAEDPDDGQPTAREHGPVGGSTRCEGPRPGSSLRDSTREGGRNARSEDARHAGGLPRSDHSLLSAGGGSARRAQALAGAGKVEPPGELGRLLDSAEEPEDSSRLRSQRKAHALPCDRA